MPLYVVHVMSSVAAAFVREARAAGQRVIGEAVVSGFASSEAAVFDPNFEVQIFAYMAARLISTFFQTLRALCI